MSLNESLKKGGAPKTTEPEVRQPPTPLSDTALLIQEIGHTREDNRKEMLAMCTEIDMLIDTVEQMKEEFANDNEMEGSDSEVEAGSKGASKPFESLENIEPNAGNDLETVDHHEVSQQRVLSETFESVLYSIAVLAAQLDPGLPRYGVRRARRGVACRDRRVRREEYRRP